MNALTIPKRDQKRSRVFLSAHVDCGEGLVEVRMRDISSTGALLESDFLPDAGSAVVLTCGKTTLQARVAWSDRGWFGVEFDRPLMVSRLIDRSGVKLKVSAPRNYRAADPLD